MGFYLISSRNKKIKIKEFINKSTDHLECCSAKSNAFKINEIQNSKKFIICDQINKLDWHLVNSFNFHLFKLKLIDAI